MTYGALFRSSIEFSGIILVRERGDKEGVYKLYWFSGRSQHQNEGMLTSKVVLQQP